VIDLMEALKKSIAEKQPAAATSGRKPPVRAVPAAAEQAPTKRAKKSVG
jgi:non-homologous end joining protein Ku